jgi:hypothetical protein
MAWTTPRTWVAGEIPTPAQFNAHVRDNFRVTAPFLVEAAGDFVVADGLNSLKRLVTGAVGSVLTVSGAGAWAWTAPGIPSGAIVFFNGTACPTGYTIVSGARGRTIVGLPSGGTLAGTGGSALTNLATRTITEVAAHTHGTGTLALASDGAHTHTFAYGNLATAGFTGRVVNDTPGTGTTGAAGTHTHTTTGTSASSGSASVDVTTPYIQYLICSKD